jgi:surface antigen
LGGNEGPATGLFALPFMQRAMERRRREAQEAAQTALDRNRSSSWSNPETGASGDVRLVSSHSYSEPVSMAGLRLAPGVDLAQGYEGASGRYQARNAANLRAAPSTTAPVVGKLGAGEAIDALARVQGGGWLLAGRDGVGVGYVAESVVRPADSGAASAGSTCRTFDQTLRTRDGAPDTQRYTACRGANGEWVIQG